MKKAIIIISIILILTAGALAGGYFYLDSRINVDGYYDGVAVGGVQVGGLTREEARDKLKNELEKDFGNRGITILSDIEPFNEVFISYDRLGFTYDYETALSEAFKVGRDGNVIERFKRIKELETKPVFVEIDSEYSFLMLEKELQDIADSYRQPPQDAEFSFENGIIKVIGHSDGTEVDMETLMAEATNAIDSYGVVHLPFRVVEPKVNEEYYKRINGKIGEFSTSFVGSAPGRIHNIKLSAEAFKGLLVMPGDEISYNQTTGPRMASTGYQEAPVIVNGDLTPGLGGGVCQTSTTLYNTLLLADLEITERHPHSLPPAYVPRGTDGAVATGYLDLRFRNSFDYPILIDTEVIGSKVYFYIYGDAESRDYIVKIDTEHLATIPYKVHENLDESLPPGARELVQEGRTGYKVSTFKSIIKDGVTVSREKISSDYYRERDFIYKVGPKEQAQNPEPTIPEDPVIPDVPVIPGETETVDEPADGNEDTSTVVEESPEDEVLLP
ncbi:MAG: VanW family protein [Gudongella sp.]|jgi:vancomycin resistance protein YoaR|nr:VanW family protein [Gudongella sp.]